jgi:hypothetical protein
VNAAPERLASERVKAPLSRTGVAHSVLHRECARELDLPPLMAGLAERAEARDTDAAAALVQRFARHGDTAAATALFRAFATPPSRMR